MTCKPIVLSLLAFLLASSESFIANASSAEGPPSQFAQQGNTWDSPPWQFNEIQRRGFQDGINGARKDLDNHRQPNVNNREEYQHPSVPEQMRSQYRQGFELGYQRAVGQLTGTNSQQLYRQQGTNWDIPQGQLSEIGRRGYQDGVEGARRDLDNHRQPNVENRDEYRNPSVPYEQRNEYRQGFQLGYQRTISQMTGATQSSAYGQQHGNWEMSPGQFSDIQRRGFRDGMDGARKDLENNRQPDVNNRDEYRSPDVPPGQQDEYRMGFERGYYRALARLTGQSQWQTRDAEQSRWDMPSGQYNEMQRRGFQDGLVGARKDYENHRRPDVNNRDEYRHPQVPRSQQDDYRRGFELGYQQAMSQLTGQAQRTY